MSRPRQRTKEEDPVKSVERVLALSDEEFSRWLDRAIKAGLRTRS